jgi:DNA modification methylase
MLEQWSGALFNGVLTSPPYNLGRNPRHRKRKVADAHMYDGTFEDADSPEDYVAKMVRLFKALDKAVVPRGPILWNMGVSTKNAVLPHMLIAAVHSQTSWTLADTVYWNKGRAMPFQTSPNKSSPCVEPVYVFARKKHVRDFAANKPCGKTNERTGQQFYRPVPNLFTAPPGRSTSLNKATFSVEMATELLGRYFVGGQRVLDPFCGSGTTLTAARAMGVEAVGFEISKDQVELFRNGPNIGD